MYSKVGFTTAKQVNGLYSGPSGGENCFLYLGRCHAIYMHEQSVVRDILQLLG